MAAPTFQAVGTFQHGGASQLTVPWPAHQTDDIGILVIENGGSPIAALTTASGFVQIPGSPQTTTGIAGGVYWCRATSNAMASVVTGTSNNHGCAVIFTIRGCITTGDPWDVISEAVKTPTSTATSITGDTTTLAECLIAYIACRSSDVAGAQYSGEADSTLTGLAERVDNGGVTGNGGGIGAWTGTKATAGAYGPMTATLATTALETYWSIALKPPASGAEQVDATQTAITVAAQAATVTPGQLTTAATPASITTAAQVATVTLGVTTIAASPANVTTAAQPATVTPAAVTITASPATITTQPQAATVSVPTVIAATPANVVVTNAAAQLIGGAVTVQTDTADISVQAQPATIIPGPLTIAASPANITVQAQAATVTVTTAGVLIVAAPANITVTAMPATATGGPVLLIANPANVTTTAMPAVITMASTLVQPFQITIRNRSAGVGIVDRSPGVSITDRTPKVTISP